MNIALIGGTGLAGPHLVRELEKRDHVVTVLNRRGIHPGGGRAQAVDRNSRADLSAAIDRAEPDLVIDNIPFTKQAAEDLAGTLADRQLPLIASSSADIYKAFNILHRTEDPPYQPCPISEDDELRSTVSFQGAEYDKLNVERVFFEALDHVVVFRLPAIYGAPDVFRIRALAEPMLADEPVVRLHPGFADWKFSYASGIDCGHAISLGVGLEGHQVFNVAEPEPRTQRQWCADLARIIGWKGEVVTDDDIEDPHKADFNQNLHISTDRIREQLGYREVADRDAVIEGAVEHLRHLLAEEAADG